MALNKASNSMIEGAPVNVKDFGAVGDGVTDDTAAIQAAVNHGITNSVEVHWPAGVYLCGALTVPSSGKLIWRSDSAEIKETGTDITLISPTGSVDIEGLKFTDYTVGFNFNSISANAQIRFHNISVENCGTIDTGGGRVDFNGFVTCGTSANTIISFRLTDSYFNGDDFGIAYRGPFKSFVVEGSDFNGFRRMAIMVGDNNGNQDEYRKVQISNNTIRTVVSDDSAESEIKGILVYGYQVNIIGNIVDTVRDIHASTHDSEAIYVKGVMYNITDNIVVDGGRGDGYITVKGNVLDGDPDSIVDGTAYSKHGNVSNNQVYASSAFTTSYGKISGIYIDGTRANIATNQVLGFWDIGIYSSCTSIINDNQVKGEFSDGIRISIDSGIFSDATFTRVNGNHIEAEGVTSTMIKFLLFGGSGHEIQNLEITNNSMFTTSTMTAAGNEAFIILQLDKNATASNTIRNAQVSNNTFHGTSGEQLNCLVIFTTNGSGANNGKVQYIDFSDNVAYTVQNVFRIAGGSGDVNVANMTGGNYQGVNSRLLSNPTLATTFVCKNVKSNRYTEIAGTVTLSSGTTSKTVSMGMQDTLRPVDLENIQVMPIEDLGSASSFYVDTLSGDSFNINVDANPGQDVDFAYVARNRFFY